MARGRAKERRSLSKEAALDMLVSETVLNVGHFHPDKVDLREFVEAFTERIAARLIGAMGLDLDATLQGIRDEYHRRKAEESD